MRKAYKIAIFLILALGCMLCMQPKVHAADSEGNFIIVLDPGHGGSDPGALNSQLGLKEADITFKLATYAKAELEQYEGVKVYLTRYANCPSIAERGEFAKNYNADLVVSLHINSGASSARGVEAWVTQDNTKIEYYQKSKEVGEKILNQIAGVGLKNNGVTTRSGKADEWYESGVVKDYYGIIRYPMNYGIRSILVEHGYISNNSDCQYFNSDSKIKTLAVADARAIADAYKLERKGQGRKHVKSLKFNNEELALTLTAQDPQPLKIVDAVCNPSNAYNKEIDYYSSNSEVVRVWGNRVRALKEGEATITAISRNNQRIAKYKVRVKDARKAKVQDMKFDKNEYVVNVNDAVDVGYTYSPTNATNAQFYWTSSNDSIIRVWGNRFRALKPGTAEVIATTNDGSFQKRVKVTVKNPGKVEKITFKEKEYVANVNQAVDIEYSYSPTNASNAEFYWTSSDDSIIRVWGNRFRALKAGTADVIVKTMDGTVQNRIKVTVKNTGKVEEITFKEKEYVAKVNDAVDIGFSYSPSNATNAEFYWTSSNDQVIRVWGNRFRALKPGTADVIVKTLDGTVQNKIKVTVKPANGVADITFAQKEYVAKVNDAVDIKYSFAPANASNAEFYWTSSNDQVIRVWGNRFRALKPGTAEVIVRTLDGTFEKRIKVTVEGNK